MILEHRAEQQQRRQITFWIIFAGCLATLIYSIFRHEISSRSRADTIQRLVNGSSSGDTRSDYEFNCRKELSRFGKLQNPLGSSESIKSTELVEPFVSSIAAYEELSIEDYHTFISLLSDIQTNRYEYKSIDDFVQSVTSLRIFVIKYALGHFPHSEDAKSVDMIDSMLTGKNDDVRTACVAAIASSPLMFDQSWRKKLERVRDAYPHRTSGRMARLQLKKFDRFVNNG